MAEVSGRRPLRPFPALDPEPPRRLTWRSLRWPAVACLTAAAVAAAFLIWPSSSPSASGPARVPFADRNGLVVFEQQPSGMLGTAAPDGSHLVTLRQVGALQGNDLPVAAGKGRMLGTVTDAVGDPSSAAAIVSGPVSASAASSAGECYGPETTPDKALELRGPGRAARTIVTAAELQSALGWPSATPVLLYAEPAPGGSRLTLRVVVDPPPGQQASRQAVVVISRGGRILAHMPLPAASGISQWSPDGQRIAFCQASPGTPSSVSVWSLSRGSRTIVLPGHHDVACNQLLWSPDGSQLIYAAWATERGLTQADNLQHGWTVIDLRSGRVHDVTAPGQPAAWIPGTAGESR